LRWSNSGSSSGSGSPGATIVARSSNRRCELSLKGLENDEFRYITKGRAADSHVIFLDEIFKANAVVLNAMLMLINERLFINNGVPNQVDLWAGFGASNELPNEPELHAFRDRFAWVKEVKPVQTDDGNISQEIAGKIASVQMNLKQVGQQVTKQVEEARSDNRDTSELDSLLAEIDADRRYIREEILN
jgi:MoxR-like ATPase